MRAVAGVDECEGLGRALRALHLREPRCGVLDVGYLIPVGILRGDAARSAHADDAGRGEAAQRAQRRADRWRDRPAKSVGGMPVIRPAPCLPRRSAFSTSSSETSSPSSISLCALPDGIIGKQLASAATRQSKMTGPLVSIIARIASSSSAGSSQRMPVQP